MPSCPPKDSRGSIRGSTRLGEADISALILRRRLEVEDAQNLSGVLAHCRNRKIRQEGHDLSMVLTYTAETEIMGH